LKINLPGIKLKIAMSRFFKKRQIQGIGILFIFFLGGFFSKAKAGKSHYLLGLELFNSGREPEAVEEFILAGKNSQRCLDIFKNFYLDFFPETDCEKAPVSEIAEPELKELVWFQTARIKWEQETKRLIQENKPTRNNHDQSLFIQFLKLYPTSRYLDRVFLILSEESFCQDWAGYPDCGMIEAKTYEQFLLRFPKSEIRQEVEVKLARVYYQMAWLWLFGNGEHIEKWAELFRAQSLKMVLSLKNSPNWQIKNSAVELEQKIENDFPRPIAPFPSELLGKDYLLKGEEK